VRRADHSSRGILQSVVCVTECDSEDSTIRSPGLLGAAPEKKCLLAKRASNRAE